MTDRLKRDPSASGRKFGGPSVAMTGLVAGAHTESKAARKNRAEERTKPLRSNDRAILIAQAEFKRAMTDAVV